MKKTGKRVILGIGVISIALAGLILPKYYEEPKMASESEIKEALKRNAKKLNLLDEESEKEHKEEVKQDEVLEKENEEESNEEVNQDEVLEKENVDSAKTVNKKIENNTKNTTQETDEKEILIKEKEIIKNEVINEVIEKEYKPVGTVNTAGKIIAVYDNINIVYINDYAQETDRYEVYVWNKDMGWIKCNGFTGISGSSAPLSMEKAYYSYTSDVDTPEDRSYKVELVVYPHPDRQKEGKCNIYKQSTGELITSLSLNY